MVCSTWRHVAVRKNGDGLANCPEHKVKRAGFCWGIGRELYTAPFIWVNASDCDLVDRNGKWQCFDKFTVTQMDVLDGRIVSLEVVNDKTGKVVYTMTSQAPVTAPETPKPTTQEAKELGEITKQVGDKRAVWQAYKANGIEGARALLAIKPEQVELFDADQEF